MMKKQLILKNIPSSRKKWWNYTLFTVKLAQINILFMIKTAKNHTFWGLYGPYNGVPPPGDFPHPTISFISFCKKKYVPEMIPNAFNSLSCSSNTWPFTCIFLHVVTVWHYIYFGACNQRALSSNWCYQFSYWLGWNNVSAMGLWCMHVTDCT